MSTHNITEKWEKKKKTFLLKKSTSSEALVFAISENTVGIKGQWTEEKETLNKLVQLYGLIKTCHFSKFYDSRCSW